MSANVKPIKKILLQVSVTATGLALFEHGPPWNSGIYRCNCRFTLKHIIETIRSYSKTATDIKKKKLLLANDS